MDKQSVKKLCDNDLYLRSKLYCRGFLITDNEIDDTGYPFYGDWRKQVIGRYNVFTHKQLPSYVKNLNDTSIGIFGHAFNPVTGDTDENKIIDALLENKDDSGDFYEIINELTGVFCIFIIDSNGIRLFNDCVGLESVFYTVKSSPFYASSHINLIGDFAGFEEDPYITRLKSCRTFYYFGNQLPGICSKFREVKRLTPNHFVKAGDRVELIRFYTPHQIKMSEKQAVDGLCDVLRKTMKTIAGKWSRPAISLTGGCDSKTTLAAANGIYDRFLYFSYDSQPNEKPDADAANQICKQLGLPHKLYSIPYTDDAFENIEGVRIIMNWNGGDIRPNNPNDVRKRMYLDKINDFDVDIKSWASEVCRARYSKRYAGKRSFGKKPTPRKCTTFYKFLLNRKIVNETDKEFKYFIENCFKLDEKSPIPWQDQLYWEWHWPSRDGITMVSEHMFSGIVTAPFNNRKVFELLLSTSYENRYNDVLYTEARRKMDSRIDKAAEHVVDVNHTKARAYKELMYYYFNNLLPY